MLRGWKQGCVRACVILRIAKSVACTWARWLWQHVCSSSWPSACDKQDHGKNSLSHNKKSSILYLATCYFGKLNSAFLPLAFDRAGFPRGSKKLWPSSPGHLSVVQCTAQGSAEIQSESMPRMSARIGLAGWACQNNCQFIARSFRNQACQHHVKRAFPPFILIHSRQR